MKRRDFGESMCDETKLKVLNFVERQLRLYNVSKCYTEQDMDDAYDKGFKDGNQRDLTGSLIEVL